MGREFISDDPDFHIVLVRQTEVLLGRHITKHRAPIPTDHRGTDAAGDVVVARSNVRGQWPERVERRLVAPF